MNTIFNIRRVAITIVIWGVSLCASAQVKLDANAQYRTVADILVLIDQIKPEPERVAAYKEALNKPMPPADAFWFTKRDALLARMDAAESLGDIPARLAAADAIMAIFRERDDRTREIEFGMSYANILRQAGQTAKAHAIEEEVAKDPKTYAHWLMTYNNRRTIQNAASGNLEAAQSYYSAAATEFRRLNGYISTPNTANGFYYTTASLSAPKANIWKRRPTLNCQ